MEGKDEGRSECRPNEGAEGFVSRKRQFNDSLFPCASV